MDEKRSSVSHHGLPSVGGKGKANTASRVAGITQVPLIDRQDTNITDLEAQSTHANGEPVPLEYVISTRTKYMYLAIYFSSNLSLTLYNKAILGKVCAAGDARFLDISLLT